MSYQLIRGDATSIPLADDSVDLVVSSPPYFALRAYQDGGEVYDGQIGSEATPQAFLDALWAWTAECRRVLKPSGSMFVNLGDKYSGVQPAAMRNGGLDRPRSTEANAKITAKNVDFGIPAKSLMMLPQRYAIGCIDQLGLILRAEIIWSKPNGLPESVTDRVRRSHEQWFHFSLNQRYFSAVDEIRESRSGAVVEPLPEHLPCCPLFIGPSDPLRSGPIGGSHEGVPGIQLFDLPDHEGTDEGVQDHDARCADQEGEALPLGSSVPLLSDGGNGVLGKDAADLLDDGSVPVVDHQPKVRRTVATVTERHRPFPVDDSSQPGQVCTCGHTTYHTGALGKLPGSVWTIPTEPLRVPDHIGVDHFAAFPSEWPRRIILGWSPSGVCVACGEGRRPVVAKEFRADRGPQDGRRKWGMDSAESGEGTTITPGTNLATITGYACACPDTTAPTRPSVVLDPFSGTGTTAAVAHTLGRHGVGIDLSADYLRLAEWRCNDPALRAKVLRVDKPKPVPEGQLDMFGDAA